MVEAVGFEWLVQLLDIPMLFLNYITTYPKDIPQKCWMS